MMQGLTRLLYWLSGVPENNRCLEFEDILASINESLLHENNFIRDVMEDILDNEIIYQKGEGPEACIKVNGELIPRKGLILRNKYFIAKRVEVIKQSLGNLDGKEILDVGATSDLIFRYLGIDGIGLNISDQAVDYMRQKGIRAVKGNALQLEFEDKSVDSVFCFETIEHLEEPLTALREMNRVAREKVFISFPMVPLTRVAPFEPSDRGIHRWHFIEFSPEDFRKVIKRAGMELEKEIHIPAVGEPKTFKEKMFFRKFCSHPWFNGFIFYVLGTDDG